MNNMDAKKYRNVEAAGMAFVCIAGTLLHFTYAWSGKNFVVGLFSAINESVWEHTKLVYFPMLAYAVFEFFVLKPAWKRFFAAKTIALAFSSLMMVVFFYTYSGIFGMELLVLDIISMYVLVALGFVLSYRLYYSRANLERYLPFIFLLFAAHLAAEVLFSILPPHIPLFESQDQ